MSNEFVLNLTADFVPPIHCKSGHCKWVFGICYSAFHALNFRGFHYFFYLTRVSDLSRFGLLQRFANFIVAGIIIGKTMRMMDDGWS